MTDTTEIAALRAQLKRVQQHRNNVVEALGIALEALRDPNRAIPISRLCIATWGACFGPNTKP